jgi:hypothetical protein
VAAVEARDATPANTSHKTTADALGTVFFGLISNINTERRQHVAIGLFHHGSAPQEFVPLERHGYASAFLIGFNAHHTSAAPDLAGCAEIP